MVVLAKVAIGLSAVLTDLLGHLGNVSLYYRTSTDPPESIDCLTAGVQVDSVVIFVLLVGLNVSELSQFILLLLVGVVVLISVCRLSSARTVETFFYGKSVDGKAPGLLTLTFSQVTTWIFARSLMNAAVLGFYYGLWGTLAYAAYYLSFLTGARIIDSLRFQQGYRSMQDFLWARFGRPGTVCYNWVIGIRLISEVFANLLVIGAIFGVPGSSAYTLVILVFATVTLSYSALGGLHASLRTDLLQMLIFLLVLVILLLFTVTNPDFYWSDFGLEPFTLADPGPVLLVVALLQVWSYPAHDPVMMDRGFIADRETTRRSFLHASWISMSCIISFGGLGVFAGANAEAGELMNQALVRLLGEMPMLLFSAALVISAMSTLDSTLSSAAKLVAIDLRLLVPSVSNGRISMAVFMLLGVAIGLTRNQDLFSAVAVSGTASMYLAPVIFFSLWARREDVPLWSYLSAFVLAVVGAVLYFTESSGYTLMLGDSHKYTKLLWISLTTLTGGCLLFFLGLMLPGSSRVLTESRSSCE